MNGRIAFGVVILGAGVLWLLSVADVIDLSYSTWVGLLLIAVGLAIALTPGRHALLVLVGVLIVLAGVPALLVSDDLFASGIGEGVESPASTADLEPFRHGIGKLTVDLTTPSLDLDGATIVASVGIGELVVVVPEDTDVSVDAKVGMGNAEALGETESGFDIDLTDISGTSGSQEVNLELEVGIGNIRVDRG